MKRGVMCVAPLTRVYDVERFISRTEVLFLIERRLVITGEHMVFEK